MLNGQAQADEESDLPPVSRRSECTPDIERAFFQVLGEGFFHDLAGREKDPTVRSVMIQCAVLVATLLNYYQAKSEEAEHQWETVLKLNIGRLRKIMPSISIRRDCLDFRNLCMRALEEAETHISMLK